MTAPAAFIGPALSAVVYVVAALLIKRAALLGVGPWRTAFVCNMLSLPVFSLLWFFGGTWHTELLWQPVTIGLLFALGQALTFSALDVGDVSVATPVLGAKLVLVALMTRLILDEPMTGRLWAASVLSTAAIVLLNLSPAGRRRSVATTVVLAGSAACLYALCDTLLQKWGAGWGIGRILPTMITTTSLASFAFVPFFREPLRKIDPRAWRWLLCGGVLLAVQSAAFAASFTHFQNATAANVVYSTRGLWSVLAVWFLGGLFHNQERALGRTILASRALGATLMLVAIVLVLWH